jgi:membrane protease YdiL (CAAX protease family)
MPSGKIPPKSDGLLVFFGLAITISWCGWLGVLTLGKMGAPFFGLVATGPALAAFIAGRRSGTSLQRIVGPWRPSALNCGLALVMPWALISLGTIGATRSGLDRPYDLPATALTLGYFTQCLFANPLEEIGWRGFALPRLTARFGPFTASLVVGLVWAVWHLPLLLWADSPMRALPKFAWAASLLAESFVFTWFYFRSRHSVAVVSLLHISVNLAATLLGMASFTVNAAVFGLAAIVVWRIAPPR